MENKEQNVFNTFLNGNGTKYEDGKHLSRTAKLYAQSD
jgi:hypothetical protein